MFQSQSCIPSSGPTFEEQPPFQWSKSGFTPVPLGHPDLWNFEPVHVSWNSNYWYNCVHYNHDFCVRHCYNVYCECLLCASLLQCILWVPSYVQRVIFVGANFRTNYKLNICMSYFKYSYRLGKCCSYNFWMMLYNPKFPPYENTVYCHSYMYNNSETYTTTVL